MMTVWKRMRSTSYYLLPCGFVRLIWRPHEFRAVVEEALSEGSNFILDDVGYRTFLH
jgi:hypothetical protein